MLQQLFSIYDAGVKTFHPPFYAPNERQALSQFADVVNDERTSLNKFPEDYDLFHCGEYDTNTGVVAPLTTPKHVTKAVTVKKQVQKDPEPQP